MKKNYVVVTGVRPNLVNVFGRMTQDEAEEFAKQLIVPRGCDTPVVRKLLKSNSWEAGVLKDQTRIVERPE